MPAGDGPGGWDLLITVGRNVDDMPDSTGACVFERVALNARVRPAKMATAMTHFHASLERFARDGGFARFECDLLICDHFTSKPFGIPTNRR